MYRLYIFGQKTAAPGTAKRSYSTLPPLPKPSSLATFPMQVQYTGANGTPADEGEAMVRQLQVGRGGGAR